MANRIGAQHAIPPGVTSCLLLPHVMRCLGPKMPERMAAPPSSDEVDRLIAGPGPAAAHRDVRGRRASTAASRRRVGDEASR